MNKSASSNQASGLLRTNTECFEVDGPKGKHICFAYEPMREPLWRFQRRFVNSVIPFPLLKIYLSILLEALDCLHTTYNVVHSGVYPLSNKRCSFVPPKLMRYTDLKLENIMMPFEDGQVMGDFITRHLEEPAEYKVDAAGRSVFRRSNEFGDLRSTWPSMVPRIIDVGSGLQLHGETGRGIFPIQPNHYRAPEVTLGFPWNRSADIWSLGTLVSWRPFVSS